MPTARIKNFELEQTVKLLKVWQPSSNAAYTQHV
jgi:hypothetical protein